MKRRAPSGITIGPTRISTNAEELIIKTIHGLLPKAFRADTRKAEFPPPKTPQQALAASAPKPIS